MTLANTRTAEAENRRYFRQAYQAGRHGWESDQPSPYVAQNLSAVARLTPGRRLLDIGCGEGRHCILAARMGFIPTGVDYEPLAIRRAQANIRKAGLARQVHFLVADVFALPLDPASFDIVLDYGCLHHQKKSDWGRYRAAILSVLAPQGYFLLSVFSTAFRTFGAQTRSWHIAHGAYRRFFTAQDLHQLFDRDFEFLSLEEERDDVRGFWHALLKRKA
jgi:cyclopropane fatty-acyl-phospholipid synthase-like methyltransferase